MVIEDTRFTIDEAVFGVDLSKWGSYLDEDPITRGYFLAERGEHYKLLAYLAGQLPAIRWPSIDIGTATGASALALMAGGGDVISYDTDHSRLLDRVASHSGAIFRTEDGIAAINRHLESELIFIDVDPHDGAQERELVARLTEADWCGLLVCDDIHLNADMERFWAEVSLPKWDMTKYGHFTGTGLIGFRVAVKEASE